jgi:type IV secretory pathway VirB4 component
VLVTRITSRNLGPLSPALWGYGPLPEGIMLGTDHLGRPFRFDPFLWYRDGLVTNPNALVLGQVGKGKSALVKLLMMRGHDRYGFFVLDPKGEYGGAASSIGAKVVRPGASQLPLNPFQPFAEDPAVLAEVARMVVEVAAGRELSFEEEAVLEAASYEMTARGKASVPALFRVLSSFTELSARLGAVDAPRLADTARRLHLALRPYVAGRFRGLVDGHKDVALDTHRATVVDLSSLPSPSCLGVVMASWFAWFRGAVPRAGRNHFLIVDEAWVLMASPQAVRFLQASFKLARSFGVSNVAVLHRYSDLSAADAATERAAAGLLADTECQFIFSSPRGEVERLGAAVDLSEREKEVAARLPRASALVRAGATAWVVRIRPTREELSVIDTDAAMKRSLGGGPGRGHEQGRFPSASSGLGSRS